MVDFCIFFISMAIVMVFVIFILDNRPEELANVFLYLLGFGLIIVSVILTYLRIKIFGRDILFLQRVRENYKKEVQIQFLNFWERTGQKWGGAAYKKHDKMAQWDVNNLAGFVLFTAILSLLIMVFWAIDRGIGWNIIAHYDRSVFLPFASLIGKYFAHFMVALLVAVLALLSFMKLVDVVIPQESMSLENRERAEGYMVFFYFLSLFIAIILVAGSPAGQLWWQKFLAIEFVGKYSTLIFGSSFLWVNFHIIFPWRSLLVRK